MEEKVLKGKKHGMLALVAVIVVYLITIAGCIVSSMMVSEIDNETFTILGVILLISSIVIMCIAWIPLLGLKVLKPQEALVLTLKIMTLNNSRQKINDCLGNPIEIGIAVTWRIVDTAKAVFNVDNYKEYLSLQCDSALRNVVRLYPYDIAPNVDTTGDGMADEGSLRVSSEIVAGRIRDEIQASVKEAGIEVVEARITYLAYAPEIAAVMLQRQQASAIIDARKMIVDGAVGMVEMALERLNENHTVELDEERKAAMVSNLLVVLCGNHDAQPVVNSGSLY